MSSQFPKQPTAYTLKSIASNLRGLGFFVLVLLALQNVVWAEEQTPSETPKEIVADFLRALSEGDVDRAIDLTTQDPQNEKIVPTLARFARTNKELTTALKAEFGDEAEKSSVMPDFIFEKTIRGIQHAEEVIDDAKANVIVPESSFQPWHLIKIEAGWRIEENSILGTNSPDEIERVLQFFDMLSEANSALMQKIKEGDPTLEALEEEYEKVLREILFGAPGEK